SRPARWHALTAKHAPATPEWPFGRLYRFGEHPWRDHSTGIDKTSAIAVVHRQSMSRRSCARDSGTTVQACADHRTANARSPACSLRHYAPDRTTGDPDPLKTRHTAAALGRRRPQTHLVHRPSPACPAIAPEHPSDAVPVAGNGPG